MNYIFNIVIIFFTCIAGSFGQQHDTARLKLVFAGDVMGHDAQINAAYNVVTKNYDYRPVYRYIKPYISQADIAIANLEVTLAGPPYKGYPRFSSPDALATALKDAGFNLLLTANNHSVDRGGKGLNRTIHVLDSLNLIHTGTFINKQNRKNYYPLIFEKKGIKIALLNITYGTNGLKAPPPCIVNYIDTLEIKNDLLKAKAVNPDMIITTIHWGTEYERKQNKHQEQLANFLIRNGTDVVIGSHPHVVQPIEVIYKNNTDSVIKNVIVYSLGNYVSNQRTRHRDGGIMFELNINKVNGITSINDIYYLPTWVYKKITEKETGFYILPACYYKHLEKAKKLSTYNLNKWSVFNEDTRKHISFIKEKRFSPDTSINK